tara:strand:+ start:13 stop:1641 length:1629 start_codon:yes stop_codon:yes gene_type:complete
MAFKIGNKTVLHDADPSATLLTNSNLDKLQINGVDVLTHDGSTVTLKNVDIKDASGVDLSDLATSVNNNTTAISNNATAILNNATAITNNATAITNNETAINNNVTAIANTLVDAKAYTDTRETAITTSYTAAIASSTSSGTSSSNSYTDSEIATATTNITTAYTTADQTILSTAQSYTDTAEVDAVTTANTYTDTREVAITSAYQTYADQAETDAKAYTDTEIANLVDTAPTTLDTLNELASALGDDANFSTTVTNSIATKLTTADFTSTADTWLGTKDTGDLSEGSNLYYTDARVDSRITANASGTITNADLDMNGNRVLFANVYATTGDLPSATTYHGMFAHVHATGKGYFAHAGNWVELANASEVFDGNYTSLSGAPSFASVATSGSYNDLSNTPTIPTNNNQLANGAGYVTTDTNTTYTAGNGLTLSGTEFLMSGGYTGNFTATGDVTAYSDKRLKRNIETITNAVDTVSKLRGVHFEKDGRSSTGVIAQEVEEVLPQVVHTAPDGMKSVAYGNIVGILIEAIKEQQKEIEELKKRL